MARAHQKRLVFPFSVASFSCVATTTSFSISRAA